MAQADWRQWYEEIAREALRRAPAILTEWIPGGRVQRREYLAASIRGGQGNSFKINLDTGRWKDFASGEQGGSNLIALYGRIRSLEWKEAANELGERFQIAKPAGVKLAQSTWTPITPIPDDAPTDDEGLPAIPALPRDDGEIKGLWCYLDAEGLPLMWRVRIDHPKGKEILPLTYCRDQKSGATAWRWRDVNAPRPLYGLEWLALQPEAPVLVVEGEKTADAARRLLPDWVCITWPGGTNRVKTKYTDWSPVANRKSRVVLWADNDHEGVVAMITLAGILANGVQLVAVDKAWRSSFDLADAEADGWTTTQTLEYLEGHIVIPEPPARDRTTVDISSGDLELQSRAIWNAVQTVNDPPWVLTAAGGLTLVDRDPFGRGRRNVADLNNLRWALASRFAFQRMGEKGMVATKPNDILLANLIAHPRPPVGFLRRMVEVPIIAPDDRVIRQEGFDAESGIYYLPHPDIRDIDLPEQPPDSSEVEGAVALIDDLIADFPFVDATDRAHAFAFALVPILRLAIAGRTPLFRFEAPQPRTGKSLLMRVLARLTCAAISDMGPTTDEEEWRKRITAALRQEPEAVLIDNAETLESASIKKLLTDDIWEDRALGASNIVRVPVQCVFGVTLNNPIISRELMGRSLRIRLDARSEHPELRGGFKHANLEEYAVENRASLVGALVTIARASGPLPNEAIILGGFEAFSRRLGAILAAAGIEGFMGAVDDDSALSEDENAMMTFIEKWGTDYGTRRVLTSELLPIAEATPGIWLGRSNTDRGKETALATFLRKHRGATVGFWKVGNPSKTRPTLWSLTSLKSAEDTPPTASEHAEEDEKENSEPDGRF